MKKQEISEEAKNLIFKWGLNSKGWEFSFCKSKSSFGYCKFKRNRLTGEISQKKICLSQHLLPTINDESVIDTILHEIAHALDVEERGYSNHDSNWKKWAIKVGAKPERTGTHDYQEAYAQLAKQSKYTHVCPNGHEFPSHRKTKRRSSCPTCNPNRFDERYVLTQVQNY